MARLKIRPLRAAWELDPKEKGKLWLVEKTFIVHGPSETKAQNLTIPAGFEFDRYSLAPDLPDWKPAAAHDRAYCVQKWDNGDAMARADADWILKNEMLHSGCEITRHFAQLYYDKVHQFGWIPWYKRKLWKIIQLLAGFDEE